MPIRFLDLRYRRSNRDPERRIRIERSGSSPRRWAWLLLLAAAAAIVLLLASCSYSMQALAGGAGILARREPVERVLRRADLPERERAGLELALSLREFAVTELALPDNGSYRSYVRLGRDVVTWNVVAAPPLSVEPRTWCFPIAGCVSYRGYFQEAKARAFAAKLEQEGDDVAITGSAAYSTLGWFDDPLLDTFLDDEPWRVAGLLFHELAHQVAYAKDDTAFNESFATAVEELGVERWLASRAALDTAAAGRERAAAERGRDEETLFRRLLLDKRGELESLYAGTATEEEKAHAKRAALSELSAAVDAALDAGELGERYAPWRGHAFDNADLAAVADYTLWVPAFRRLFEASGDFREFYRAVEELAALEPAARRARFASPPDSGSGLH